MTSFPGSRVPGPAPCGIWEHPAEATVPRRFLGVASSVPSCTSRCQGDTWTPEFVGSDGRTTAQVTWENIPAAPAGARGQRDAPGWQGTSEQWAPAGRGGEGRGGHVRRVLPPHNSPGGRATSGVVGACVLDCGTPPAGLPGARGLPWHQPQGRWPSTPPGGCLDHAPRVGPPAWAPPGAGCLVREGGARHTKPAAGGEWLPFPPAGPA